MTHHQHCKTEIEEKKHFVRFHKIGPYRALFGPKFPEHPLIPNFHYDTINTVEQKIEEKKHFAWALVGRTSEGITTQISL